MVGTQLHSHSIGSGLFEVDLLTGLHGTAGLVMGDGRRHVHESLEFGGLGRLSITKRASRKVGGSSAFIIPCSATVQRTSSV